MTIGDETQEIKSIKYKKVRIHFTIKIIKVMLDLYKNLETQDHTEDVFLITINRKYS